jgi:type IV pilus assembly protein PilB
MPRKESAIEEVLLEEKILKAPDLLKVKKEAKRKNTSLVSHLVAKNVIAEEELYEKLANHLKRPYINLTSITIRKDVLFLIPEPIAQTHNIVAFEMSNTTLKVATSKPGDIQIIEFIEKKTGKKLDIHLASNSSLQYALKQYHKSLQTEFKSLTKETSAEIPGLAKDKLNKLATDLPVVRIVDTLLEYAVFEDASDIHIEPSEKEITVRYRIDGILRQVMTLPKNALDGIVARIKILANLKVDEHRLPQDGRFKIHTDQYRISLRVSLIPTYDGEKMVMRLLDEKNQLLTLEQLGLLPQALDIVKRNIQKPHGMLLVTGPTGSGKTSTLYSVLNVLNIPEVNISTIEDPIEYRMEHINQSQVNPKIGFTFANGLRSFLRQDPDIIMVGEIRDQETAEIAIHAAMTGHLVLSTLHTNDAVGTVPRLLDMNIAPFMVSSTLSMIIGQRLVRKICIKCIESYMLDSKEIKELGNLFDIKHILQVLAENKAIAQGNQKIEKLRFYRGKGCKNCNNTGYKGRIGIYEVLEATPEIKNLISHNAPNETILKVVKDAGMIFMLEDGFIKAKNGITTLEEVIRVSSE